MHVAEEDVSEEEVIEEEVVEEEELASNIIDFNNIVVGDTVGGMTVTEIKNHLNEMYETEDNPLSEWNSVISFDGEVELTGEYIYYDADQAFFGDLVCITSLDEESEAKLPLPEGFSRTIYMCFENYEDAKTALGITGEETTGEITFIIDWFQYVGIESSVWNWANLVEVLDYTVGETELADSTIDFDTVAIGDDIGGLMVLAIENPLETRAEEEGAEDVEIPVLASWNAIIDFQGVLTLTGTYELSTYYGDIVCITELDEESLAKLPLPEDFSRTYMCFENVEEAKEMMPDESGEATFTITDYQYVGTETSMTNVATLVEVL